ncbi:hypothetical protein BDQ12DRAFT_690609 [Crucibulum laeve]|uniref:Uncharacterized protein n=1 Tax=Crucibulum laeve TaxID=68775 RepID=A0A5C3LNG2_9AGAR|nr:hypothetical protein BDQ12DRAFT_690609 [Crucibulum laeve]
MSDLASGIVYLCCCCCNTAEPSPDGTRFGTLAKKHPREQDIDDQFLSREYCQDSNGRIHVQPSAESNMRLSPNRDAFPSQTSPSIPQETQV